MNTHKALSRLFLTLTLMLAVSFVNASDVKPSGTIKITETEVMALMGGSKGNDFNGL